LGTSVANGNTTAPTDDPGFANIGIANSGSAVYLGNGWVLTAAHVYNGSSGPPVDTWFGNVAYKTVPGSAVQLTNPAGVGYTPYTDLEMYKLTTLPPLRSLSITDTAPAAGWQVTMIGNGRDRSNQQTAYWNSSWQGTSTPSTYAGELWATTQHIRWGTNVIDIAQVPEGVGSDSQMAFMTSFSQWGTPYEAQGAPGDSGGGVFHKDATTGLWYLAGIMFGTSGLPMQPWGTSVFGNSTWSADLYPYRTQIYQTMAILGDVNYDGIVNGQDIAIVASNWLKTGSGTGTTPGDVNRDGIVNGQDMAIVASNWTNMAAGYAESQAVPEPSSLLLAVFAVATACCITARRRCTGRGRA